MCRAYPDHSLRRRVFRRSGPGLVSRGAGCAEITGTELLIIGLVLALGGGLLWRFGSIKEVSADKTASVPNENEDSFRGRHSREVDRGFAFRESERATRTTPILPEASRTDPDRLARIEDLKVISRTSTEKYASHPENLTEIAQELGVAKILEGAVQKAGNAVTD